MKRFSAARQREGKISRSDLSFLSVQKTCEHIRPRSRSAHLKLWFWRAQSYICVCQNRFTCLCVCLSFIVVTSCSAEGSLHIWQLAEGICHAAKTRGMGGKGRTRRRQMRLKRAEDKRWWVYLHKVKWKYDLQSYTWMSCKIEKERG